MQLLLILFTYVGNSRVVVIEIRYKTNLQQPDH